MASRLDKYKQYYDTPKRSDIKKSLYDKIYEGVEYSNVEGIVEIDNNKEIDLERLKDLLKKREIDKEQQIFKKILTKPKFEEIEEKNYDLKDMLDKAKSEKEIDTKPRSLSNTGYDILKSIKINKEVPETDDLKELINTITKTSALNKLNDKELCLSMFEELQASDKTLSNNELINKIINESKKESNVKKEKAEEIEVDRTFFTSGYNFDATDFENLKEIKQSLKKNRTLFLAGIISLVLLIIITVIIYVFFIK